MSEQYYNPNSPERLVVFSNPNSSHAETIQDYLKLLENRSYKLGVEIVHHETEPEQSAMNESWMANVQDADAVAVASGDGGTAMVLTAAIQTGQPVATLLGGNANDLAHMLHTNSWLKRSPHKIIQHGTIATLTPLEVTARTPDGYIYTNYCYAYWGAGASAQAGERFNIPEVREHLNTLETKRFGFIRRFVSESVIVNRVLHNAPTMIIDDGEEREIIEKTVVNGSRMAKSLHFPTKILETKAGVVEVKKPTIASLMTSLGKAAINMENISGDDGIRFIIETRAQNDIVTHIDGEDHRLPSGTEFSISLAPNSVNVYTSRCVA